MYKLKSQAIKRMVKLVQAKHLVATLFDSKNCPWRRITMRITQV
jgi:hypothetical protein